MVGVREDGWRGVGGGGGLRKRWGSVWEGDEEGEEKVEIIIKE